MNRTILILSLLLNILLAGVLFYAVNRLGGIRHILFRIKNGGIAGVYHHRTHLLETLEVKQGDIIFLGNSITEQGEWREFFDNPSIKNRGIAGDFTDGVQRRLTHILDGQPAKIFLMIGVNDLIQYRPPHIIENYRQIVAEITSRSPNTELYLQSILPVNASVKDLGLENEDIVAINEGIKAIAASFGLRYIDLHRLMVDEEGRLDEKYTKDGIHINHLAYAIWVEEISPLLTVIN